MNNEKPYGCSFVPDVWWSHHITGDLAAAKTELPSLNIKLKHTPVIIHFHGKEFVRVLRDSEMSFTRGDGSDVPGRYSQVWHVR